MSKKTKFMRVGAALMVLALGTSCFVGGTLAKYTKSADASDYARVAKFGVTITNNNSNAFASEYAQDDTSVTLTGTETSKSVKSTDSSDVIAPGTRGTLADFTITGTPEVAVSVTYKLDDLEFFGNWYSTETAEEDSSITYSDADYYPIVFKVTSNKGATNASDVVKYFYDGMSYNGSTISGQSGLLTAINDYLKDNTAALSNNYGPNTNLSTVSKTIKIEWEWPFEGDVENMAADSKMASILLKAGSILTADTDFADVWKEYQTDTKDTALGDYAAGLGLTTPPVAGTVKTSSTGELTVEGNTGMPVIAAKFSVTVTQID